VFVRAQAVPCHQHCILKIVSGNISRTNTYIEMHVHVSQESFDNLHASASINIDMEALMALEDANILKGMASDHANESMELYALFEILITSRSHKMKPNNIMPVRSVSNLPPPVWFSRKDRKSIPCSSVNL
jgi:hypothetical protein